MNPNPLSQRTHRALSGADNSLEPDVHLVGVAASAFAIHQRPPM